MFLNSEGDAIIVELKRDRTPREVTAQALDYASWVCELSNKRITAIASAYFGKKTTLEEAFRKKFSLELPEGLNVDHGILVVASQIDATTERIINYLSEHGVNINALTFKLYKTPDDQEILSRIFLIKPEMADYRSKTRGSSKRLPNLTREELKVLAQEKGIGEVYVNFVNELDQFFKSNTTRSSLAFNTEFEGKRRTLISLRPKHSSSEKGLNFILYLHRLCDFFKIEEDAVYGMLPGKREDFTLTWSEDPEWTTIECYFRENKEVECFIADLKAKLVL